MTEKEIFEAYKDYDEAVRKRAIKALFEKESINIYDLSDFKIPRRIFLWAKVLICLLLKRTRGSYFGGDKVCVLAYDEHSNGESGGYSWEACWVSVKCFSEWQVCLASDGS